jgi:UDP-3-O-[3-hydroxymyristoyl] glucosamine N-acyltransferase
MSAKKRESTTLGELAKAIGGELVGEAGRTIRELRPFDQAQSEDLTFLDPKNARMLAALSSSRAGGVIVGRKLELPPGLSGIRIDPPHLGLARALRILYPPHRPGLGVSPAAHLGKGVSIAAGANIYPGAYLGEGVKVGEGTDIFPGAYIGDGSSIGAGSTIHPNVTICEGCSIGNRVVIHAGAVIGADGFGYVPEPTGDDPRQPFRHLKIPQVGRVVIEDDVEIGANTTIDRATLAATVIGRGTKIDNLVMIAHNCTIGRHGIIVSQAGISGSTEIGDYVTIAGQAGLVGHITVGDRAVVTAQAGVTKDIEAGKVVIGAPAMDIREGRLAFGLVGRLPELKKNITELMKQNQELRRRLEALEANGGGGRPAPADPAAKPEGRSHQKRAR